MIQKKVRLGWILYDQYDSEGNDYTFFVDKVINVDTREEAFNTLSTYLYTSNDLGAVYTSGDYIAEII
jgi:hypothetical protein